MFVCMIDWLKGANLIWPHKLLIVWVTELIVTDDGHSGICVVFVRTHTARTVLSTVLIIIIMFNFYSSYWQYRLTGARTLLLRCLSLLYPPSTATQSHTHVPCASQRSIFLLFFFFVSLLSSAIEPLINNNYMVSPFRFSYHVWTIGACTLGEQQCWIRIWFRLVPQT